MELFGATREDFARVKVKNARHGLANPYARYRKEVDVDDVLNAPIVSDPLGLLDICATSDGAAALVVSSLDFARRHGAVNPVRIRAISTVTPSYPQTTIELPNFATDSAAGIGAIPAHGFKESIAARAYAEAGLGPDDLDCAEVYDLSTAMELDWYEQIGICAPGEAEKLVRDGATSLGGRIPVNASGGLASFGEAVPAQAIAQVCELTWQVQGRAEGRQVEGARTGLSINQGLFGHGSAVIVTK
jgi:acetyl-CoA acetyltransferase